MEQKNSEVHIWYLFHSGFAVKTDRHFLVFDYYSDTPEGADRCLDTGVLNPAELAGHEVLVFSSHRHSDHFNPVILDWRREAGNIQYVLSSDIKKGRKLDQVQHVFPGRSYTFGSVLVEVLDSTDVGAAFLVSCDGLVLFHAGDLNWWHWEGEPDVDNDKMAESYKKQVDLLLGRDIDIAFIPVDPRLETAYLLGLDYFMNRVGARKVFPMHFGNDYSVFDWLRKDIRTKEYREKIEEITRRGQHFLYKRD